MYMYMLTDDPHHQVLPSIIILPLGSHATPAPMRKIAHAMGTMPQLTWFNLGSQLIQGCDQSLAAILTVSMHERNSFRILHLIGARSTSATTNLTQSATSSLPPPLTVMPSDGARSNHQARSDSSHQVRRFGEFRSPCKTLHPELSLGGIRVHSYL